MKSLLQIWALLALSAQFLLANGNPEPRVKLGNEVLVETKFKALAGKRVGLITNPSGVNSQLESTIDVLRSAPNVKLVALYGPEHGIYGDVPARDKIASRT